jgi:hypothetical protein
MEVLQRRDELEEAGYDKSQIDKKLEAFRKERLKEIDDMENKHKSKGSRVDRDRGKDKDIRRDDSRSKDKEDSDQKRKSMRSGSRSRSRSPESHRHERRYDPHTSVMHTISYSSFPSRLIHNYNS